jgi:hypothetical protein
MRRLSIDPRKIAFTWLVPFEIDESKYGISYMTVDGYRGCELIGTLAETESVLQDLEQQQNPEGAADIVPFPTDTAAS